MMSVFLWLTSLGVTISRFTHVAAHVSMAFFHSRLMTEQCSGSGHSGRFHVSAIEHSDASIFSN